METNDNNVTVNINIMRRIGEVISTMTIAVPSSVYTNEELSKYVGKHYPGWRVTQY